ncbi:MAG: hypothetical protein K2I89_10930, partial [Muribaculaceae bacterium]|nr:hypothetical protein [Muribaculaceae bacterium]
YDADLIFLFYSTSCARLCRACMWLQLFRGYAAGSSPTLAVWIAAVAILAILAEIGAGGGVIDFFGIFA